MFRRVDRPTVVLGSTQPSTVVDAGRVARAGVDVVRRRSGGGLVYLAPGDPIWADAWIPRGDPLWRDDVLVGAEWAGEWWRSAVAAVAGPGELRVHRGSSVPTSWSSVCFAGTGPGEVLAGPEGPKVVGLAQWRSREGSLVHGCAYRSWDPEPLVDLLATDRDRSVAERELAGVAVGVGQLAPAVDQPGLRLVEALVAGLPAGPPWTVTPAAV
ncbi:MAG TPA: hypothetical protein VHW47_04325 [Acidimicrobiales bacterium]|nr:hypothetical protein [Acidimicrobiales bacterium]